MPIDSSRRRCVLFAAVGVLLLLPGWPAMGQDISSGFLRGVVRDETGAALSGVAVRALAIGPGLGAATQTDLDGQYRFPALAPGRYDVLLEQLGHRPRRIVGVPVRPGSDIVLDVRLAPIGGAVTVDTVPFAAQALAGSRAGVAQSLDLLPRTGLPGSWQGLTALAGMATFSGSDLEVEGLPSRLSGVAVDGMNLYPVQRPGLRPALPVLPAPIAGLSSAELLTNPLDVEWSGHAGGYLSAVTRAGEQRTDGGVTGLWSGASLQGSSAPGLSPSRMNGQALLSGSAMGDSARFALGVDAARVESGQLPAGGSTDLLAQITSAARARGVEVAGTDGALARLELVRAFGRFDLRLSPGSRLALRALASGARNVLPGVSGATVALPTPIASGGDVSLAGSLYSRLSATFWNEAEAAVDRSTRTLGGGTTASTSPLTVFGAPGVALGQSGPAPGTFGRTTFQVRDALHVAGTQHRLKFGASARVSIFDDVLQADGSGTFLFGGVDAFTAGKGAFVQRQGPAPAARFNLLDAGFFAQDDWTPAQGVALQFGVRLDVTQLPSGSIAGDTLWRHLSGIDPKTAPASVLEASPRVLATWNVQGRTDWIVRAGVGVDHDEVDPPVLDQVLASGDGTVVRRALGVVGWPNVPSAEIAPVIGRQLALFGPAFRAPRTSRASFGITHELGGATLDLAAVLRHTEFLPRRRDLNLAASPLATDQYGRAVYGTLTQLGGLLLPAPGSNRRFGGYDVVSSLDADGSSDYAAGTIGIERFLGPQVRFFARYTYSHTTDNWTWALLREQGAGFLLATDTVGGRAWARGRSDFDVPDRASVGIDLGAAGSRLPHVTVLYRYRSGYPFTPVYGPGVDANGDGSVGNDPAYIDQAVGGTAPLLTRWSCLRSQTGRFADRNSCRLPGVHALDARLTLPLLRLGATTGALVVDAVNLVESTTGMPDVALYLADPTQPLVRDPATGALRAPLVANPHFGEVLAQLRERRGLWIGLNLSY